MFGTVTWCVDRRQGVGYNGLADGLMHGTFSQRHRLPLPQPPLFGVLLFVVVSTEFRLMLKMRYTLGVRSFPHILLHDFDQNPRYCRSVCFLPPTGAAFLALRNGYLSREPRHTDWWE